MLTLPPDLRRVPPASFVAARDALARRLRKQGDPDAAAMVRKLRRPSASLWAVNYLAEVESERLTELVRVGQALRASTQAALRGQQVSLGRLGGEHAHLVEELTGPALQALRELPASASRDVRVRVWTILRVASLDPDLAPLLAKGALAEEPVSVGFDSLRQLDMTGVAGEEAPAELPAQASEHDPGDPEDSESRRRLERADHVREATTQLEFARVEAEGDRARLGAVRERVRELRTHLATAEREEAEAERDLAAAEVAVAEAEQIVERLRGSP